MKGSDYIELRALLAVADHGVFARAADALNMSPSSLSQAIRSLETRLGVRLLNRTTRSVSPTEAGERLIARLRLTFDDLDGALREASATGGRPSGPLRINASRLAARRLLAPRVARFLAAWPEVTLEIIADDQLVDIVAGRFDAGVRLGESLEQYMISVAVSPPLRQRVVGSPDYLRRAGRPSTPADLAGHACLNFRWPTSGKPYRWEFERGGEALEKAVAGPLISNDPEVIAQAAADGAGLAMMIEDEVASRLETGALISVLDDWTAPFAGFHLYYPGRRHLSPALRAFIDHLKD